MAEAVVDFANEISIALDDENTDNTEPIDEEASWCDTMFEELQSELWPEYAKMLLFNFLVKLDAFEGHA